MSLSVNNSYQQNVAYVFSGLPSNLFMYTQSALFDYVDKHVSNPTLKLIMTGHGRLVDCDSLTKDCLHLFETEWKYFISNQVWPLSANDKELYFMAISNYVDFIYQNFTPLQLFEAVVICMFRNCKVFPKVATLQAKICSESFKQHKHLINENPKLYCTHYAGS